MNRDSHRWKNAFKYLCASVCICGSISLGQSFTPPNETFLGRNQLTALQQSIQDGKSADAAERADALLHEVADQLFNVDGGSMISVRLWLESLPSQQRQAMTGEYDKLVGEQARANLEAALQRPGRRPEDLLAAAVEYPLSSAAREALGQAAMRSLDLGDVSAAAALAARARDVGWKPPSTLADALVSAKPLPAGVSMAAAMPWYPLSPQQPAKRVIPVLAGGVVLISTERALIASKETGELLWQYAGPKQENPMPAARNGYHRPAVLCDGEGKPQVVVVRQLIGNTRFGCLRGFRASDGKLLWSTESNPATSGWSLASTPVIAGRTTWVLAVDEMQRPAPLVLMAIETMTGRFIRQTPLGNFQNEAGDAGADIDKLWAHSGVTVDGGDVFVATGTGMVARVDRFDGRARWVRTYPPVLTPGEQLADLARRAPKDWKARKPLNELADELRAKMNGQPLDPKKGSDRGKIPEDALEIAAFFSTPDRWQTTPAVVGNVVVIAASDAKNAVGLDRSTGAQLWENADVGPSTLVGAAGSVAVFADDGIVGIDIRSGKNKWTWTDAPLEGPPNITGSTVRVMAGGKIHVINGETGGPDALVGAGPTILPVIRNDASKAALTGAEAVSSLQPPAKAAEPRKR